jgi:hypothetical protein
MEEVCERLAYNDLYNSPEKYIWAEKEVEFLPEMITPDRMGMAKDKMEAIED